MRVAGRRKPLRRRRVQLRLENYDRSFAVPVVSHKPEFLLCARLQRQTSHSASYRSSIRLCNWERDAKKMRRGLECVIPRKARRGRASVLLPSGALAKILNEGKPIPMPARGLFGFA